MTRDGLEAVARGWIGLWCVPVDWAMFDRLHADEFVDHSPGGRPPTKQAFAGGLAALVEAFPDLVTRVDGLVIDEAAGRVAVRWSARGTNRGRYLGIGPTQRMTEFAGIEIIGVRDGRIVERWGEWDISGHRDDGVRDAYDRWAPTYDSDDNRTRDLDGRLLRALDWPWSDLDVVEIGCGTGKNTEWLAPRSRSVVGLDVSLAMLDRARKRAPAARFVRADLLEPWPLDTASADAVRFDLVLEHVATADLPRVFAEARRVLRPGGRLRVCELHPDRQAGGSRAHFHADGQRIDVPAHAHVVEDYASGGFGVAAIEHAADGDERPRLVVVTLVAG
jgi:ubiquinone/menaquinone biosynthesis C-methylase UbiE/predicted ester cyclase